MSKGQKILQGTYIFLFFFSGLGIVGNIELGEPIPKFWLIVYAVSTFLTFGKVIYLDYMDKKGGSKNDIRN